jgi:maltooligosyltrehalose trehalohydrolase
MERTAGQFRLTLPGIAEGQRYLFRLETGAVHPDPRSRWQPEGVSGPSAVLFPDRFVWHDAKWAGVPREDLVIYEMHVGAFTPEGTFEAAIPRLPDLRQLGVTAIELMPVVQFPGTRSWGYDGAFPFAVQHSYGGPHGLQRFVDACHETGLAVILDASYHRLGQAARFFAEIGPYTTPRKPPVGAALNLNLNGPGCRGVRDFVLASLQQWIRDYHLDGLRLESVAPPFDASSPDVLAEIQEMVQTEAERLGRPLHLIADSDLNDVRLLDAREQGGNGLHAQWNADFHHAVHALLTGERDGRYVDFDSREQLVKVLNQTFALDGCFSKHRGCEHGASAGGHSGDRFVISIQNHDEVGQRAGGERFGRLLHPGAQRLAAGLLLLAPHLPLIFMGEEYGETRPFPLFISDAESLAIARTDSKGSPARLDPQAESTLQSAQLTWQWPRDTWQEGLRELYADLISARRSWPPLRDFVYRRAGFLSDTSAVLSLRRGDAAADRGYVLTAYFNFGNREEPLPREGVGRVMLLSSESPRYAGTRIPDDRSDVLLPFEFQVYLTNTADRR